MTFPDPEVIYRQSIADRSFPDTGKDGMDFGEFGPSVNRSDQSSTRTVSSHLEGDILLGADHTSDCYVHKAPDRGVN